MFKHQGLACLTACVKIQSASPPTRTAKQCSFHYPWINGKRNKSKPFPFFVEGAAEFCHTSWLGACECPWPQSSSVPEGRGVPCHGLSSEDCQPSQQTSPPLQAKGSRATPCYGLAWKRQSSWTRAEGSPPSVSGAPGRTSPPGTAVPEIPIVPTHGQPLGY